MSDQTLVVIPARMASTRLPGKPLADIGGVPMIVQVWYRAREADVGPVVVACAEQEIADAVTVAGGVAVLTRADHPSGSDRIHEALGQVADDPDRVINLQGDLPTINPADIRRLSGSLAAASSDVDIATLVTEIRSEAEAADPDVVKAVVAFPAGSETGKALYFSRLPVPGGDTPRYHHIGIYAYRRAALTRFVSLPPSPLEKSERLEQLRALEAGMSILACRVDTIPLGVDTPAHLAEARRILLTKSDR
ncbi:MAG: 3-deoxy-manno-octulosonate cytidylyltransferase [Alphaproteobacteria bacterium]|nr:3-deoxy-manno-octulosonate cytidylyltransferase [Alphaproteobacteria bacterium]